MPWVLVTTLGGGSPAWVCENSRKCRYATHLALVLSLNIELLETCNPVRILVVSIAWNRTDDC